MSILSGDLSFEDHADVVSGTGLEVDCGDRDQFPSLVPELVEAVLVGGVQAIVFRTDVDNAIFPASLAHTVLPPRRQGPFGPAVSDQERVYHPLRRAWVPLLRVGEPYRLSVVIPALNEEGRLPATLESIRLYLEDRIELQPAELIVVDDGSEDRTAELVQDCVSGGEITFRCLRHEGSMGKGAAVRTGFGASRGEKVLISDADLSAPIEELGVLLGAFSPERLPIGSRAVDRSLIFHPQPMYRDLMGRCFNLIVQGLLIPGIRDTQCGFKLFPGELAHALAAVGRIDGFAWDVEFLYLARFWGFEIRELGVRWAHVESSRVLPGRHSFQMFRDVLKLGLRRAFGKFPARPQDL